MVLLNYNSWTGGRLVCVLQNQTGEETGRKKEREKEKEKEVDRPEGFKRR